MSAIGWIGSLLLTVSPGGWLVLSPAFAQYPFSIRLALAVMLSPLALAAEFYLLRLTGLPFAATAWTLVVVNAPALVLFFRQGRPALPALSTTLLWGAFLSLPAVFFMMWMGNAAIRATHGHAGLHAAISYMLANGELRPEDPHFAGVELAYPWLSHVQQSTISYLAASPPNVSYLVLNVIWLIATFTFVAALVRRLGGDHLAQAASVAWLSFAVNVTGLAARWLPSDLLDRYPIWGDGRYTPWIRKFAVFEATMIGIGLFAATLYAVASIDSANRTRSALVIFLLLASTGLIYPVLFPASLGLVALHLMYQAAERWLAKSQSTSSGAVPLVAASFVSAAVWLGYVVVVRQAHGGVPSMMLSDAWSVKVKLATAVIVLAPCLLGLLAAAAPALRTDRRLTLMLVLASLGLTGLTATVDILYYANEYKFIFVVAVCLVPLAVRGQMRLLQPLHHRLRPLVAFSVVLAMAIPALLAARRDAAAPRPALDWGAFRLRLSSAESLSAVLGAVQDASPVNSVVVSGPTLFDLAAVTSRPVYLQPDTAHTTLGIGLTSDYLLKSVRGYPKDLVDSRRANVDSLFGSPDPQARMRAIQRIGTELGRPVALLLLNHDEIRSGDWIRTIPGAVPLHADSFAQAWLLPAPPLNR